MPNFIETFTMKAMVSVRGTDLEYASPQLKQDREIVLAAVAQNGLALKFANTALKSDKDIVMVAVDENGLAIQYSCLSDDKDIAKKALNNTDEKIFQYFSSKLQSDKEIAFRALISNMDSFSSLPICLKVDHNFLIDVIGAIPEIYYRISTEQQSNRELVLGIIERNAMCCYNLKSMNFYDDKEIVLKCCKKLHVC